MAWSGGTFTRVHDWTSDDASDIDIEASRMDQEDDNFETGINTCLTKDGQNTPTADLPMGGNKHTGVGEGSARNHYAAIGQLQDGDIHIAGSVAGTDTITGTMAPAITAYTNGMRVIFLPANDNTGAATLNLNSVGAQSITKNGTTALAAGDLVDGVWAEVIYDLANTNWVLQNPTFVVGDTVQAQSAALDQIAALADDDSNFIVGNGSAWVAESGATARASLGANSATNLTTGELADARLSSNVPLLDANNSFSGNIDISSSVAILRLIETDATADEGGWRIWANGDELRISTEDDAGTNPVTALEIERTGTAASLIALTGTSITANAKEVLTEDVVAALTNITVADTQPTDSLLINDGGTAKQIDIRDMGVRVVESSAIQTFALDDANTLQTLTGATGRVWTIPTNASVAFPIGACIYLAARDTAAITVTAASGVTLTSILGSGDAGSDDVTAGGMAVLIKVATDHWMISGDIA